jgi:hypothetical protein
MLLGLMRPNVSNTPLQQWGFQQCLPFSWTTLRGKHCRHPIAVTFGLYHFHIHKKMQHISHTYPIHVVTFMLISNLATDYIQKRKGEPGLFSFEYDVKVTTWIGHKIMLICKSNLH